MAKQIKKLISRFMNYSGTYETDGFSIGGITRGANTGSVYSAGKNGNGSVAAGTVSPTVAKVLLLMNEGKRAASGQTQGFGTALTAAYDPGVKQAYAEIRTKNQDGTENFDICRYSVPSGVVTAATISGSTGDITPFEIGFGCRIGTVVMAAVLASQILGGNQEAEALYRDMETSLPSDWSFPKLTASNIDYFMDHVAALSDNLYFRLKNGNLKLKVEDQSGISAIPVFQRASLDTGAEAPDLTSPIIKTVGTGKFNVLVRNVRNTGKSGRSGASVNRTSFLNDFILDPARQLDKREKELLTRLPEWYEIPKEAVIAANNIKKSSEKIRPQRNILLKGPAGTGKTEMAKAIAAALGLPYTHQTCDAGMELYNLVGTLLPATGEEPGVASEENAAGFNLPTVEDVYFDYEDAYFKLTGETEIPKGLTEPEVVSLLFKKQMEAARRACPGTEGKDFVYVPSELIKAVKYGWVCEIQEPTVIIQPGVLPGLNSLLEGGSISLPTGEVVKRHPDSVIIFTTNTDYEGCRPMNESVLDRFPMKFSVDLPDEDTLVARAAKVTGVTDNALIHKCMECMDDARDYLLSQGCGIGNVGPRTLYDWIDAADLGGDAIAAAEYTLLASATDDPEIVSYIRENIVEPKFY